jgi:hypothetical protein
MAAVKNLGLGAASSGRITNLKQSNFYIDIYEFKTLVEVNLK